MLKIDCKKKARFGLFALVLILCVGFSLFAFMSFGANTAGQTKPGETSVPTGSMEATPTPTPTANNQTTDVNSTLISEAEALALAMPVIEKYAAENNRTIASVVANLCKTQDFEGRRGGYTLEQITQENTQLSPLSSSVLFPYYQVWQVNAKYNDIDLSIPSGSPPWYNNGKVTGYFVNIWADLGEIYLSEPIEIAVC